MASKKNCYICHKDITHKQRYLYCIGGVAQWVCAGQCYQQAREMYRKEQNNDKHKRGYRG